MGNARQLADAHLPTWLKAQLRDASRQNNGLTYLSVGWHLGHQHPEAFDLEENGAAEVTEEEIAAEPTKTLRRIFASERHPKGDLVDVIPSKRRRDFLRGVALGVAGEDFPEKR